MPVKLCFISLFALLIASCAKEQAKFHKVTYEVVVYPGNEVGISYNSDYAIDSGKQEELVINDSNNVYSNYIWSGIHIQQGDEPYYIKTRYIQYQNPLNYNYGVFVYVDDSLVDQKILNTYTPEIVLTGSVATE